jgi:glucose-1-phosphate cytidylyltransferase
MRATECIILAGGLGTRMAPLPDNVPKVLRAVGGKPLLEHIVAQLSAEGIRRFVIGVGYGAEYIEEWASAKSEYGDLVIVNSGLRVDRLIRLRTCAEVVRTESAIVTYGDGLGDISLDDLHDSHERANVPLTITLAPLRCQFGVADLRPDGLIEAFREKPRLDEVLVNIGYMLFSSIADVLGVKAMSLETEVLPKLAHDGTLGGYVHRGYWRNVDTLADLRNAQADAERGVGPWLTEY